ncbi:DUF2240 domain-containing protein [Salinigranum rubrum]|uniref:DUF2240 domain-containing protein n=1 Tax=Salinigranum rubrum TaxID=755307 RepID=A0A2I8VMB2_9EURY|nr:DUF2240 family protein [Salinigranum rubrum]AUV83035.1 DUF2240 domain-containing protein [Salinigranum rubrum]
MSMEVTVAVPFRQHGTDRLGEGEFVVALSLDREWFSPDQAKRLIDIAAGRGLVERDGGDLVAQFSPGSVEVPEGFTPDESILQSQSTFERLLGAIVADGVEKQEAVAGVNRLQRDLGVTIEAAAVLYARRRDIDIGGLAEEVRRGLVEG